MNITETEPIDFKNGLHLLKPPALKRYKNFKFNLPKSLINFRMSDVFVVRGINSGDDFGGGSNKKYFSCEQFSHNQLEGVKRRGTYTTTPKNLSSQTEETWRISPLIQKGSETIREEVLDNYAYALRFVLVHFGDFIYGSFSLISGFKLIKTQITDFLDLIFGVGKRHVQDLEEKIEWERCKFIVAELVCRNTESTREIGRYVRSQITKAMTERVSTTAGIHKHQPAIPYLFLTPNNKFEIDLRLFDRSLMRKLNPILSKILERCNKQCEGWFMGYREKVISELGQDSSNLDDLELAANRLIMEEFLTRLYTSIRSCEELEEYDRLLIEQAQIFVVFLRSLDIIQKTSKQNKENYLTHLSRTYPLLSRDNHWKNKMLEREEERFYNENKWLAHEIAIELCKESFLQQAGYFLQRDLVFLRDTAPILRNELSKHSKPCRVFQWDLAFKQNATPHKTTTGYPLWRLQNFIYRSLLFSLTLLSFLKFQVLEGPFSIKALINPHPYGESCRPTMISRLTNAWRNVSKFSRRIKKNKLFLWAVYSFYGILTILWLIFFPLCVAMGFLGCLVFGCTFWIWSPLASLIYNIWNILIYDNDSPTCPGFFPVFRLVFIFLWGVVQVFCCLVMAGICPIVCFFVGIGSTIKYAVRLAYDKITFHLIIKQYKEIPCKDNWFARRVLEIDSRNVVYEITPLQAIIALRSKLEQEELNFYEKWTLKTINAPLEAYKDFFSQFTPFSLELREELEPYKDLIEQTKCYKCALEDKVLERKKWLETGLSVDVRSRIRMRSKSELGKTLRLFRKIVIEFYSEVFDRYGGVGFFEGKGLEDGDWNGLTLIVVCEVFSMEFLSAVGTGESPGGANNNPGNNKVVRVEMNMTPDFSYYDLMMEENGESSEECLTMTRVDYKIHLPYLSIDAFSPHNSYHYSYGTTLLPPPILHPVYISVIIHNRETESPYDFESPLCQAIVRALQDSGPTLTQSCISLDISSEEDNLSNTHGEEDSTNEIDIIYLGTSV